MSDKNKRIVRHGLSKHPLYSVWNNMKSRCCNKNSHNYHRYGERGIDVCDDWVNSPHLFIKWALNNGWSKGLQIDRIDNDEGYSPDNCRFVSHEENQRNKSTASNNKSGYRGVHFKKKEGKWYSQVAIKGKNIHVGVFSSPLEAAIARNRYIEDNGLDLNLKNARIDKDQE